MMPHEMQWTRQAAARYWDFLTRTETDEYFSDVHGDAIIRYVTRHSGKIEGRLLDFGCGPGYFLERLAHRGLMADGLDFSSDSLERARSRMQCVPWTGELHLTLSLPSDLKSDGFDTVFLIETIEHLLGDELAPTLAELHRLTAPGGRVVVTTPHDEDLSRRAVMCPECECVFHRFQHVSRWTPRTLGEVMERTGFQTVSSRPAYLARNGAFSRLLPWAALAAGRKPPHLIYIGRKPRTVD